jgi:hypothetical protein
MGMGEQTSKYDSMTPAQIAATLTTPMIVALGTGIGIDKLVPVAGRSGTIVALIERGLVNAGPKNLWTPLGGDVARIVLGAHVPAYATSKPIVESAKRLDALRDEVRKLDGYYDADNLPQPLDVVQLAHGAIGVVERVNMGGDVLIRSNDNTDGVLSVYDANALRSVPPIAFQVAGVPGAVDNGNVPRDYATSELSARAVGRARRIAPATRLTQVAIKADDHREYGRGFVYAIASIIDTNRLVAARCENGQWHESAPSRRLQLCAHCDTRGGSMPAPVVTAEPDISALVGKVREATEQLAAAAHGGVAVIEQAAADASDPATTDHTDELVERIVRRAYYSALRKVLDVLEGSRETQRENHDAMSHRGESFGEQCWEHWHSSDFRTMVTDAARELGTADPMLAHVPVDLPAPS